MDGAPVWISLTTLTVGDEVFALCDGPLDPLFFIVGSADVQERIHETPTVIEPVSSAHIRLGMLVCDDQGGVARPGRAVRVSDNALWEASPEPQ